MKMLSTRDWARRESANIEKQEYEQKYKYFFEGTPYLYNTTTI